jgi:hypothetical protein
MKGTQWMAAVTERHGASLAEFFILDVVQNGVTEDEAVQLAKRCLSTISKAAVLTCIQKGWLLRSGAKVQITPKGKLVASEITSELAGSVRR